MSYLIFQALEELNIKPKYWKDLIDDTPFTRKDIIHLQDPLNLEVGTETCETPARQGDTALGLLSVKELLLSTEDSAAGEDGGAGSGDTDGDVW